MRARDISMNFPWMAFGLLAGETYDLPYIPKSQSNIKPHQGSKERARRIKQMEKAAIKVSSDNGEIS